MDGNLRSSLFHHVQNTRGRDDHTVRSQPADLLHELFKRFEILLPGIDIEGQISFFSLSVETADEPVRFFRSKIPASGPKIIIVDPEVEGVGSEGSGDLSLFGRPGGSQ